MFTMSQVTLLPHLSCLLSFDCQFDSLSVFPPKVCSLTSLSGQKNKRWICFFPITVLHSFKLVQLQNYCSLILYNVRSGIRNNMPSNTWLSVLHMLCKTGVACFPIYWNLKMDGGKYRTTYHTASIQLTHYPSVYQVVLAVYEQIEGSQMKDRWKIWEYGKH